MDIAIALGVDSDMVISPSTYEDATQLRGGRITVLLHWLPVWEHSSLSPRVDEDGAVRFAISYFGREVVGRY